MDFANVEVQEFYTDEKGVAWVQAWDRGNAERGGLMFHAPQSEVVVTVTGRVPEAAWMRED